MADYTIKNLRDSEDMAPKFGLAPDMQARFPASELGLEATGVSLQALAPNATQPFGHSHKTQEEVYLVLSGEGRVKLDDEIVELRQWDAIRIPPGVMRAVSGGPDGIEWLAFGATSGTSAREDAETQTGWWNGQGAGV
jgi:mannose-6-phosphate isomerase-like protein (cupin superfamily)